jgi:regulatory protein
MTEDPGYKDALSKVMSLCSQREYCTHDIVIKLQSWGVPEESREKIISILLKENFINNLRYSKAFARDRFSFNKWGKIKIASALKAKGITAEIIGAALGSIDNELYIKVLNDLVSDHRKHIKAKNQYDLKGKLLRYGLSKGFESELLYDLLSEI